MSAAASKDQGFLLETAMPEVENEAISAEGPAAADSELGVHVGGTGSEDSVSSALRRRTENCQALFEVLQQQPGNTEGDWIDKMSAEFNWWSLGIGATKHNHSSLDYRVQNRDDVRNVLINLLDSLSTSLENCIKPPQASRMESHEGKRLEMNDVLKPRDAVLKEQVYYIQLTLKFLGRVSAAIRKSGTKFKHERIDKLLQQRTSALEVFRVYLQNIILLGPRNTHLLSWVLNRYTETGSPTWKKLWIVLKARFTDPERLSIVQARLIHANVVRRNRFEVYHSKYNRLTKQSRQLEDDKPEEPKPEKPLKVSRLALMPQSAEITETVPDLPKQQPPTASIVLSSQSATAIGSLVMPELTKTPATRSVTAKVSHGVMRQEYPRCPVAEGNNLWCPYCAQLLDASYSDPTKNRKWRGHLAQDLIPYVCIYPDCNTPEAMYVTTDEWKKHMKENYSVCRWICDSCWLDSDMPAEFEYDSENAWMHHLTTEHDGEFEQEDMPYLAEGSQRTALPPVKCPLCHGSTPLLDPEADKHIEEHLHSFSLQALPWETIDRESGVQASVRSGVRGTPSLDDSDEASREEDLEYVAVTPAVLASDIIRLISALRERIVASKVKGKGTALDKISETLLELRRVLDGIARDQVSYPSQIKDALQTGLARLKSILQTSDGDDIVRVELKTLALLDQDISISVASLRNLKDFADASSRTAQELDLYHDFSINADAGQGAAPKAMADWDMLRAQQNPATREPRP